MTDACRFNHPILRILDALKMHGPQTAAEVAARLELSLKAARAWLRALDDWELVTEVTRRSAGFGHGRASSVWDLHESLGKPPYEQVRRSGPPARTRAA